MTQASPRAIVNAGQPLTQKQTEALMDWVIEDSIGRGKLETKVIDKTVNAIPQPNRMIKLFQNKGDVAFAKYLVVRAQAGANNEVGSPGWQAAVAHGLKLETESTTWFKAAELLRKEELQK